MQSICRPCATKNPFFLHTHIKIIYQLFNILTITFSNDNIRKKFGAVVQLGEHSGGDYRPDISAVLFFGLE